jgi:hypothetical protein
MKGIVQKDIADQDLETVLFVPPAAIRLEYLGYRFPFLFTSLLLLIGEVGHELGMLFPEEALKALIKHELGKGQMLHMLVEAPKPLSPLAMQLFFGYL